MTFLIINYSIINKLQYNIITLWIMKGVIFKTNSAREGACNMRIFDLHSDLFTDIAWRKSLGEKNIFDRIHYPNLQKGGVESVICVFWEIGRASCRERGLSEGRGTQEQDKNYVIEKEDD